MTTLPQAYEERTRRVLGEERFSRYRQSFGEAPPVSIRLNPLKADATAWRVCGGERVAWCRDGYYLPARPNFTADPLLHAGCYYVQEASSMFLDTVLRQHLPARPVTLLDLCAAPGGKSTLARTVLPAGSVLYSNEPVRNRASVLAENVQKWGWPDCVVTNSYPQDYRQSGLRFDAILCDVPCSGEGMFRKDPATRAEWSVQKVAQCQRLQRDIASDAWACLSPGGLLVYSTCTLNTEENEENVQWLCTELGAELLPVATRPEWGVTGSLLAGFDGPVYRFIPGLTRGEGLFVAVLRKGGTPGGDSAPGRHEKKKAKGSRAGKAGTGLRVVAPVSPFREADGTPVDLSYADALRYLRHEALLLADTAPRGVVAVSFQGHVLGLVKNIGQRANNLYPKEWKIKTTHTPGDYEPVIEPIRTNN